MLPPTPNPNVGLLGSGRRSTIARLGRRGRVIHRPVRTVAARAPAAGARPDASSQRPAKLRHEGSGLLHSLAQLAPRFKGTHSSERRCRTSPLPISDRPRTDRREPRTYALTLGLRPRGASGLRRMHARQSLRDHAAPTSRFAGSRARTSASTMANLHRQPWAGATTACRLPRGGVVRAAYCCLTPEGVAAAWWPLRCKYGRAGFGTELPLGRLLLARSRLAPAASG
jgi:hypothetical protein